MSLEFEASLGANPPHPIILSRSRGRRRARSARALLALVIAIAALVGAPRDATANDTEPGVQSNGSTASVPLASTPLRPRPDVRPNAVPDSPPRLRWLIPGISLLTLSYGTMIVFAGIEFSAEVQNPSSCSGNCALYGGFGLIPILGPIIAWPIIGAYPPVIAAAIVDSAIQVLGLVLLVNGLTPAAPARSVTVQHAAWWLVPSTFTATGFSPGLAWGTRF